MKKLILSTLIFSLAAAGVLFVFSLAQTPGTISGAPPYDPSNTDFVPESEEEALIRDWKRPGGPPKVALQVGHWKNDEVPDELHRLRGNSGATGGGVTETEVNMAIAELTKELLEKEGITVELLPATIPPHYWADVFVAIHADGHTDTTKTGFKAARPRRDYTGNADTLLSAIRNSYEETTGMVWDEETITRNMRGYYAFSWWRYEHAIHPMTPSVILETGFLTSPGDREIIVRQPEIPAEGLAGGILTYLRSQNLTSQ